MKGREYSAGQLESMERHQYKKGKLSKERKGRLGVQVLARKVLAQSLLPICFSSSLAASSAMPGDTASGGVSFLAVCRLPPFRSPCTPSFPTRSSTSLEQKLLGLSPSKGNGHLHPRETYEEALPCARQSAGAVVEREVVQPPVGVPVQQTPLVLVSGLKPIALRHAHVLHHLLQQHRKNMPTLSCSAK